MKPTAHPSYAALAAEACRRDEQRFETVARITVRGKRLTLLGCSAMMAYGIWFSVWLSMTQRNPVFGAAIFLGGLLATVANWRWFRQSPSAFRFRTRCVHP